ncbi:transporter substrate-binding domain-containing protein [Poseidonibacter lekithochrous]|uniref:transporter substrate-binding domain-containing protein n=1 Tax=Poseidonibacter TaxID=2321187 RepID=UPI001C0A21DA|nr:MULTISPECIES: transporter substrate-binding domain-containing protein [Poseidonibacter]MBU3013912.1 transporter substrate-binding domain-containing protein [Poseidonibacter lekithochrous]MDO6827207.1 transporter substrate-binding domain-containing protein [Poseidonibacter sp. 1_MG-2023]
MFKNVLLRVLALGAIAGMSLFANQLDDIKASGVVKIAVPQDFPPFGSASKDMSVQGYDVDMGKYIAEKLGVKLKLVPVTSANRIPYLQTGKADLIISSLGKNEQRAKVIDFTNAYAPFFLGVFGSKDIAVSSIKDLSGKTVGVTRGSVEDLELSKIAGSDVTIKRFEDNSTTISAFISGQTKLIATGNVIISDIANKFPDSTPETKFTIKNSPCYIGIKKKQPEVEIFLNDLISELKANGKLNETSKKWLKIDLPKDL